MKSTFCFSLLFAAAAAAPAQAHEGWGIVSTPSGPIYFADVVRRVVWRLDLDGTLQPALEDVHTHALTSIGDGSVYGAEANPGGRVWRIDAAGRLDVLLPASPDSALGLQSFLIDTDGSIYSAIGWAPAGRATLLRRRPDGIIEKVAGGFTAIDGMVWAPDGAILLADGPYLRRVDRQGGVETLGGGALTEPRGDRDLMGVTTDGSGGAFVADYAGGRLLDVGRHAGVAVEYAATYPWSPTGVARDARGLLVLEHQAPPWSILGRLQVGPYLRVRRLGLKGRVETLVVLWGTRSWIAGATLAAILAAVAWRVRLQGR